MRIASVTQLMQALPQRPEGLIAIDGFPGSGKSTLARDLSAQLAVGVVHLDDYLIRNKGGFVEFLQYPKLKKVLHRRPLIVEGVCLLEVLKRLDIRVDILIYVEGPKRRTKKISPLLREASGYHKRFEPFRIANIVYSRPEAAKGDMSRMNRNNTDVDLVFIQAKTKIALTLAGGGILALIVGLAVLMYGVTGQDHALLKGASIELSASGLGGVIMATSGIWAFFAYKSRPTYRRIRQASEKYDAKSRLIERREHDSASEAAVSASEAAATRTDVKRWPDF
jgi:hypothetical protein